MLQNRFNKIWPRVYLIIIYTLFSNFMISAQPVITDPSAYLGNLFVRMLNSNNDNVRSATNDSIRLFIDSYVRSDSVFAHKFTSIRYLGQIDSPDSRLKIITWNLVLRSGNGKYYCYIIRKGGRKSQNTVYELTREYNNDPLKKDFVYDQDSWYGALYYNIIPFRSQRTVHYALLGISYGSTQVSRKVIEILSFNPEGKPVFGSECLMKENTSMMREVFEYSAEGVMTLRRYSPRMIVFDHLDAYSGGHESNYESYGPGLYFDGYVFKKGAWHFTKNVDVKNKKNQP